MKLRTLLQDWVDCPQSWDREISGLTLHSQQIKPGELFIAALGPSQDGRQFITEAIAKGASLYLCLPHTQIRTTIYVYNEAWRPLMHSQAHLEYVRSQ